MTSAYRRESSWKLGFNTSLIRPVTAGPSPLPIRVWTNRSSEVATDRMRTVASDWVITNDGPKNTAAMKIRPTNDGSATLKLGDRYARNWNGTQTRVAAPGTHKYHRRS